MDQYKVRKKIFPDIGIEANRPRLNPPYVADPLQSKLPFGPQNDPLIVKHRSALPLPFDRLKIDLETIFRLARTDKYTEVENLLSSRHNDDPLDLNCRIEGRNYQTPLFDAAYNKQLGMVHVLLKYKANPNAQDKLQRSPLHIAAINNSVPVCKTLLNSKANPIIKDKFGRTALEIAIIKESSHVVNFLKNWLGQQHAITARQQTATHTGVETTDREKYSTLFEFLDPLGHSNLVLPVVDLLNQNEEPLTVASLYNLEPSKLVAAHSSLITRKQARRIWKAIPDDVIRQAQMKAAGW